MYKSTAKCGLLKPVNLRLTIEHTTIKPTHTTREFNTFHMINTVIQRFTSESRTLYSFHSLQNLQTIWTVCCVQQPTLPHLYTMETPSNYAPSSLQVLAKPGIEVGPSLVHHLLVVLTEASFDLPLNSFRGGVHECMRNIGIYVHFTWHTRLLQLLL